MHVTKCVFTFMYSNVLIRFLLVVISDLFSYIQPARVALRSGCEGIAAINTIMSVMGINLDTLRPEPCVEGFAIST